MTYLLIEVDEHVVVNNKEIAKCFLDLECTPDD